MTQLFTNNAASKLAANITAATTSITLEAGDGAKFPAPAGGDDFIVTLYQRVGAVEANHEIMVCTARVGDVLTVTRAQEGTIARAFAAGDFVELRLTAGAVLPVRGGALTSALNEAAPVIVASASAITVGSVKSNTIQVTGSNTIATFDVAPSGVVRRMFFMYSLTLVHNFNALNLLTGANMTTGEGDWCEWISAGNGRWYMVSYNRANGDAVGTVSVAKGGTGATAAAGARANLDLGNVENKSGATIRGELTNPEVVNALGYTPWHAGNDGAASGLDADLLDGYQASALPVSGPVQTALGLKENAIPAGTDLQVWRGDKTWFDFATGVRASFLTGLAHVNAVVSGGDTVLSAIGKLQGQINRSALALNSYLTGRTSFDASQGRASHLGSRSGAISIDMAAFAETTLTLTGASTITMINLPTLDRSQVVYLRVTNGGTYTITWGNAGTKLQYTGALSTGSTADLLAIRWDGLSGVLHVHLIKKGL